MTRICAAPKDVTSRTIQARDGEIGHVSDFVVDDEDWAIRYLVVDTRNWWPGKKVLISTQWIERISWEESKVFIDLTRGAVKASPEYTKQLSSPATTKKSCIVTIFAKGTGIVRNLARNVRNSLGIIHSAPEIMGYVSAQARPAWTCR